MGMLEDSMADDYGGPPVGFVKDVVTPQEWAIISMLQQLESVAPALHTLLCEHYQAAEELLNILSSYAESIVDATTQLQQLHTRFQQLLLLCTALAEQAGGSLSVPEDHLKRVAEMIATDLLNPCIVRYDADTKSMIIEGVTHASH